MQSQKREAMTGRRDLGKTVIMHVRPALETLNKKISWKQLSVNIKS